MTRGLEGGALGGGGGWGGKGEGRGGMERRVKSGILSGGDWTNVPLALCNSGDEGGYWGYGSMGL